MAHPYDTGVAAPGLLMERLPGRVLHRGTPGLARLNPHCLLGDQDVGGCQQPAEFLGGLIM